MTSVIVFHNKLDKLQGAGTWSGVGLLQCQVNIAARINDVLELKTKIKVGKCTRHKSGFKLFIYLIRCFNHSR